MKLPLLSLDLRDAPVASGTNYVDVIDVHERTVARIFSIDSSYDHAGEMVDRINHWPAAIAALRRLAIIPTMAPGIQQVVHDGFRCLVCRSTLKFGAAEIHSNDCPLKGTAS